MKIQIHERDVEVTQAFRVRIERRLSFALSRFGDRIGQVTVQLSNARGKREKRCQIEVSLLRAGVRVEHSDVDLFAAVDRAAHRASRSIARAIEQQRDGGDSS